MQRKHDVHDAIHLGMRLEELCHSDGVALVLSHANVQRLHAAHS